jgi:hypothetical protein
MDQGSGGHAVLKRQDGNVVRCTGKLGEMLG